MSADDFQRLVRHPAGGYTHLTVFASDPGPDPLPTWSSPQFDTLDAALAVADAMDSEYGVHMDPACLQPGAPLLTEWLADQGVDIPADLEPGTALTVTARQLACLLARAERQSRTETG